MTMSTSSLIISSLFSCSNSHKSVETLCDSYDEIKSDNLKKLILEYFSSSEVGVPAGWNPVSYFSSGGGF